MPNDDLEQPSSRHACAAARRSPAVARCSPSAPGSSVCRFLASTALFDLVPPLPLEFSLTLSFDRLPVDPSAARCHALGWRV